MQEDGVRLRRAIFLQTVGPRRSFSGSYRGIPYGSKDPNNGFLGPKYHYCYSKKPNYLVPWTTRDRVYGVGPTNAKLAIREWLGAAIQFWSGSDCTACCLSLGQACAALNRALRPFTEHSLG